MRLALDSDPSVLTVRSYSAGEIVVGEQHLHAPLILAASTLIPDWAATSVADLTGEQLQPLLQLAPHIILLGTDSAARLPDAAIRRDLAARGIALETMTLGAACRTYNVLVQEHRAVVAGLFPAP